ncbi:MAG: hypothetical protein IJ341_07250 [Bacteroidales bacterium]|nr:hypothetical protein [Bacteroidales bacterium]
MKDKLLKHLLMIVFLQVGITTYAQSPNPIVKRLSQTEISQCLTPSSIAYNFIESILCRDLDRMLSYTDCDITKGIINEIQSKNLTNDLFFTSLFSEQGGQKLNILGWIPALARNYEVAIAYVQDTWYYEEDGNMYHHFDQVVRNGMIYLPEETEPRAGILEKMVYVTCSPTAEINYIGFQNITRYGNTNVKVLLKQINGIWKVTGFK